MHVIVTRVLARHDLTTPDGRPLCTYLVTDDELDTLVADLRAHPPSDLLTSPVAFVLAASELWRRHYDGGAWAWDVITSHLGWSSPQRSTLKDLVERGLRFWNRPVLRLERREYLASVAREAGIPSPVLQSDGRSIHRFFRALLEDLALYGTTRIRDLARLASSELPERLRNDTFLDLAFHCAQAARELAAINRPLADIPDWQTRFPLRLDDDAAQSLVKGLVKTASETPPSRPLRVITHLAHSETTPRLIRSLVLPKCFAPSDLGDIANVDPATLPPRIDLLSLPPENQPDTHPTLIAHLVRRADVYYVEPFDTRLPHTNDTRLALRSQGRILASFSPPGATLTDLPWVFTPDPRDDTFYRLIAQGSSRFSADSHALVAALTSITATPTPISSRPLNDRILHRIEADTRFTSTDLDIRVRPGTPSPDETFYWDGPTLPLAPQVYLGVPRLVRQLADGTIRYLTSSSLEVSQPALGRTRLRFRDRDELRFEDHLIILPPDTKLDIRPLANAPSQPHDRIRISLVSQLRPELGTTLSILDRTDTTLELAPLTDTPPARFDLYLAWPEHDRKLALALPYPRRGVRIIDVASGEPVQPRSKLSLNALHRYRAEGYSTLETSAFLVEARLESRDTNTASIVLASLQPSRHGLHTLPLFALARQLDRLLATSADADAHITLRFSDDSGGLSPLSSVSIARFPDALTIDRPAALVHGPNDADFCALDIAAPDTLFPLPSSSPGRASLSPLSATPTSWLVMARRNDAIICAPKLFRTPGERSDRSRLVEALDQGSFETRTKAIDTLLAELAESQDDPAWTDLDAMLTHPLPISTFEAIRAFIRVPSALCTLLLRSSNPHLLVARFEALPFLWACLPITALQKALRSHASATARYATDHPSLAALFAKQSASSIRDVHQALTARYPGLAATFEYLGHLDSTLESSPGPELAMALASPDLYESVILTPHLGECSGALRQRHADSHWPDPVELDDLAKRLPAIPPFSLSLPSHQRIVHSAPTLAALCAAAAISPSPLEAFALRLCESFDPDYFADAHRLVLPLAVARLRPGASS